MQIEPAVMQALGALVDIQAAAVEGPLEAAAARRYQLADEGSVCVHASVNHSLKLSLYIYCLYVIYILLLKKTMQATTYLM